MQELRHLARSANHLMVFEAAARAQSFTIAALELNVTQPAVSRSIRELEAALGMSLFSRGHRSVTLTEEGEVLYQSVSAGFGRMLEAARRLHRRAPQAHVTFVTSSPFANYWLVPRLSEFRRRHPDIDLALHVSSRSLDLTDERVSLSVWLGGGDWPGIVCARLADEEIFPVASPALMRERRDSSALNALVDERLIHLDEAFLPARTWTDWFDEMKIDYHDDGSGLRLNDYTLVLQAAMAGEGIALGWHHLVDRLIEQGLLVPVGDRTWKTGDGFYLVWSRTTALSPSTQAVRDWALGFASP